MADREATTAAGVNADSKVPCMPIVTLFAIQIALCNVVHTLKQGSASVTSEAVRLYATPRVTRDTMLCSIGLGSLRFAGRTAPY